MALQNLINVGVTAADVIMLGAVGEKALSGASLAGQIQYIMTLFLFGLTSGATVLTAQYWGKGDRDAIEKILGMAVKAAVCVTALFTVSALAVPELLMQVFTNDPVVVSEGVKYLRIVAFTYIMMGVTQAYLYIMRSVERVVVATVVYLLSLICNIIMNAIFIFGLLGLPKMGVAGAALGTLCARILEVVLVAIYARLFNREIRLRFKYVLHTDKILFSDFMRYALPVVVNEVLWGLGTAANTAILGHMGSAAVAANSVAQVARQLATVVSFGLSSAAAIYLGKTIGEKKTEYAKAYAKRFLILSIIMGILGGTVILAVSLSGHEHALFYSSQKKRIGVQAIENLVKKYSREITTTKKITPHKLRSTYGTALYQETGDIYLVADVLGHRDVNTTKKHYAALDDARRRQAATAVKLRED